MSAAGPPTAAVVPPGSCVFGEEWAPSPLLEKKQLNHDTVLLTFGLAEGKPLNLPTCGCMLVKSDNIEAGPVIRPYTPVSTNAMIGKFDLMVKVYPDGKMSGYMQKMEPGHTLDFKHIKFNVKKQYPFDKSRITMLVGGTGITPMIQALHAILGTESDNTKVTVLYGSKTESDILAKDVLDSWESSHGDQLNVVHVLSNEPEGSSWKGKRGFIGADLIKECSFGPGDDGMFFVCGPPPMYNALCGARDQAELSGLLKELGYSAEQVYKF